MRLLNVTTLEVESFAPDAIPKYAILSHRWTSDEVSFQDMEKGTARAKGGFVKIKACCDIARTHGISHVWADTCCIDKSSSAELSEAINSMFRYYQEAEICYAYLHDASGVADFLESDWFDRGWTLQELVAPRVVLFYNSEWTEFGGRHNLSGRIEAKTGIRQAYLHGRDTRLASIAERMSWAARRRTTRPEDISYCLLGIFDIHMPLLYGEGAEKAFVRLQREILKDTTDESWLAWGDLPESSTPKAAEENDGSEVLSSVLAKSPAYFWNCRDIVVCQTADITPISTSNLGIHVDFPEVSQSGRQVLLLGCRWRYDYQNVIGISVRRRMGRYYRASMNTVLEPEASWTRSAKAIVKILGVDQYREPENPMDSLYLIESIDPRFALAEVYPSSAWEPSITHVRVRRTGGEAFLPRRLLRLEYVGNDADGSNDTIDYIIRLDGTMLGTAWVPRYELGILPKNVQLSDTEQKKMNFGQAIRIPGELGALAVKLEIKSTFMTDICVVKIYMDMADPIPGTSTYHAGDAQGILVQRPEVVQGNRRRQKRLESLQAAQEESARLREIRSRTQETPQSRLARMGRNEKRPMHWWR